MPLEGFELFDFDVGVASASITPNGVTFNRSVVLKLGYPSNVQLLINKATKQVAIVACEKDADRAIEFYKGQYGEKPVRSVRCNSKDLLNTLSEMMHWNLKEMSQRVEGKLLEGEQTMVFDLTKAKPIDSGVQQ